MRDRAHTGKKLNLEYMVTKALEQAREKGRLSKHELFFPPFNLGIRSGEYTWKMIVEKAEETLEFSIDRINNVISYIPAVYNEKKVNRTFIDMIRQIVSDIENCDDIGKIKEAIKTIRFKCDEHEHKYAWVDEAMTVIENELLSRRLRREKEELSNCMSKVDEAVKSFEMLNHTFSLLFDTMNEEDANLIKQEFNKISDALISTKGLLTKLNSIFSIQTQS
jgi:hypothetical protein